MLLKNTLLIYCFLIASSELLYAQTADSKIEPGNLSSDLLASLITQKINEHRISKQLTALKVQEPLQKAASQHASYMGGKKKLTHTQERWDFKTPALRVYAAGGNFNLTGENVAQVPLPAGSTYESVAVAFIKQLYCENCYIGQ